MKKWMTILLTVLLILVLIGAGFMYNGLKDQVQMDAIATAPTTAPSEQIPEETGEEPEQEANPAPDFTVYDLEGNPVKLSDLQGKPVILNFWATWCGFCVQEMPDFQEAFEEYGDEIHFMMVNATDGGQETVEKASGFISDRGFTFPVYYDTSLSAVYAYGVNAMPVTYFIDGQGNFVAWGQGALNRQALQQGIDMLLTGQ